ncbi:STE protein kinase [Emergomyces pasteurianus Ep9510]|uniref:non-specific serine/threonine protein kinase n=1 Tax=Emergomyces pasteurianus Ep9510 TaxID=1447872 RepID=A0A1J9PI26_9EURO|nr:STE protein kinase [Emergomyces pasteurianus Ep9510]
MPPRPVPHPRALFSLLPMGENAQAVLNHPSNRHLLSKFLEHDQEFVGIEIGFHIGSAAQYTLATLGRSGADITVDGPSISRIQCSFEVLPEINTVMLYDRSNSQTTEVCGPGAISFEPGRLRRIVVRHDINNMFRIRSSESDLIQFRLVWHRPDFNSTYEVKNRVEIPEKARTVDFVQTTAPSGPFTTIQSPTGQAPRIRYASLLELGRGTFGEVSKVIDVDSGRIMAVKSIQASLGGFNPAEMERMRREIHALDHCSHPHIVEYIHFQETSNLVEIFTALKNGNVLHLTVQQFFDDNDFHTNQLLYQMLMALDYLAHHGIIHRDVKPANILFSTNDGNDCQYQLTDFGLCNAIDAAKSGVGTPMFMAPEVLQTKRSLQTPKVDIWALFVTMAYVKNADGYRLKQLFLIEHFITAAREAANTPSLLMIKDMAEIEPENRASAARMLVKNFSGKGLTTPLNNVKDSSTVGHSPDNNAYINNFQSPHPQNLSATAAYSQEDVIMRSSSDAAASPQLGWAQVAPQNPSPWPTGLGRGVPGEGPQWQTGVPNRVNNTIDPQNILYLPKKRPRKQQSPGRFGGRR